MKLNLEARCKSAVVNVVYIKETSTPVLFGMVSVLPVKQNGGDVTSLAPLVDCFYGVTRKLHHGLLGFLISGQMKTNYLNFNILTWQQHSYEHNIITCKFTTVLIIAIISLFAVLALSLMLDFSKSGHVLTCDNKCIMQKKTKHSTYFKINVNLGRIIIATNPSLLNHHSDTRGRNNTHTPEKKKS